MLYPKEDRLSNTLMFACRTCQFSEPAGSSCVYRNSLKETIAETPGNVQDVAQDPTVGDSHASSHTSDNASSSFPSFSSSSYYYHNDTPMDMGHMDVEDAAGVDVVPAFCTFCGEEILCPVCERPTDRGVMLEAEDPEAEVEAKGDDVVEMEKKERALSGAGLVSS